MVSLNKENVLNNHGMQLLRHFWEFKNLLFVGFIVFWGAHLVKETSLEKKKKKAFAFWMSSTLRSHESLDQFFSNSSLLWVQVKTDWMTRPEWLWSAEESSTGSETLRDQYCLNFISDLQSTPSVSLPQILAACGKAQRETKGGDSFSLLGPCEASFDGLCPVLGSSTWFCTILPFSHNSHHS